MTTIDQFHAETETLRQKLNAIEKRIEIIDDELAQSTGTEEKKNEIRSRREATITEWEGLLEQMKDRKAKNEAIIKALTQGLECLEEGHQRDMEEKSYLEQILASIEVSSSETVESSGGNHS
jgi:hypothetical protein